MPLPFAPSTRAFQARVLSLPTLHNIILSEETTSGGDNSVRPCTPSPPSTAICIQRLVLPP